MKSEKNLDGIREILKYNQEDGVFIWIKRQGSHGNPGEIAGSINIDGWRIIKYKDKDWKASRLAWYFVYGHLPELFIDHINGDRSDDRISNLREVTNRENGQNRKEHRGGRLVGAYRRTNNKWVAQIQVNYKKKWLGTFDSEQEASNRYWEEVSKLGEARKGEKNGR